MSCELEPIELSYTLTRKDVRSYYDAYLAYAQKSQLPHLHLTGTSAVLYNLTTYGVPALAFGLAVIQLSSISLPLILSPVGFYVWMWLMYRARYQNGLRRWYQSSGLVGEHWIRVDKEGFSGRGTATKWTIFWPCIADISVIQNYILFVGGSEVDGSTPAIPIYAFPSQQEAERFVERAIRLWKSAPAPDTR
jgi:hypothetical protein